MGVKLFLYMGGCDNDENDDNDSGDDGGHDGDNGCDVDQMTMHRRYSCPSDMRPRPQPRSRPAGAAAPAAETILSSPFLHSNKAAAIMMMRMMITMVEMIVMLIR